MSRENSNKNRERVIAYIDGFNLYFGLKTKRWKRYYWLNVQNLMFCLLKENQVLEQTKYFTSRVKIDSGKMKRQNTFIEALSTLKDVSLFFGKYLINEHICKRCKYKTYVPSEKMTDVNIALEMLADAFQDRFDTAFLISADSDLKGLVTAIRKLFPSKKIIVGFPPERRSWELKKTAHGYIVIGENELRKSQFPDEVRKADGYILKRPETWR